MFSPDESTRKYNEKPRDRQGLITRELIQDHFVVTLLSRRRQEFINYIEILTQ
jgi:hypothetical protein